jgi:Type I restriction modification DNA specificity domain
MSKPTTKKLKDIAEINYGNKFDLNKMTPLLRAKGGVNFVGRSSENNGVSASVAPIESVRPYPGGMITVALGGSRLLASFVQTAPFYSAQNVAVLEPKTPMTFAEKVFLCMCIRQNRSLYSAFGREANRTLGEIAVPDPSQFPAMDTQPPSSTDSLSAPLEKPEKRKELDQERWSSFEYMRLFAIRKGKRLTKADMRPGPTRFIGATDSGNGLTARIAQAPKHPANTITVNYNGNGVAEAYYQDEPFCCTDDVNVLYPRFQLNWKRALFITTLIRLEKFRFSYGRKWNLERMCASTVRLPTAQNGEPDWNFIEEYIASLPFSSQVKEKSTRPQ